MKRSAPLRAVVFDFDGTLVDSLPLVLEAIAHAIAPFGQRPAAEIFARLGGPPERFLPLLVQDPKHVPEALARMDAFHSANDHLLEPFAGVGAMLEALRAAGVQAAIWTGRDRESTERLLRAMRLDGCFATVVCGDDLPTHKPDPSGLREIMRRLGVASEETIVVGDADVDVLGGCACGVDAVLIRHSRTIAAEIESQCWHVVATPAEAFDLVMRCSAAA